MLYPIPCRGGGKSMASCNKQKRSSAKRHAPPQVHQVQRQEQTRFLRDVAAGRADWTKNMHLLLQLECGSAGWLASFDPVARGETSASGPLRPPFPNQAPWVLRQHQWLSMGCGRSQPPTYFLPC